MQKGGTEDQRKRKDLWSRIEKIKKMDPNLEYTAAELQERRRKRLGGVTVSQLQSLTQPQIIPRKGSRISDLLRRGPGVFTYKLNTEYYLNSIALTKESRPVKNEPSQGDPQSPVHIREDEPIKKSSPPQVASSDVDKEGILPVQNECIKLKPVNGEENPIEELIETEERKEVQPQRSIFAPHRPFQLQLTSKSQGNNELAQQKRAEMAAIFRKKSPEPEKSQNEAKPEIKPLFGFKGFENNQRAPLFGGPGIFDTKPVQQSSNPIPSPSNEVPPQEKKEIQTQPLFGGISLFAKQGQKKQASGLFTKETKQPSKGLFGASSTTTASDLFGQVPVPNQSKLFSAPASSGLFNSKITPSGSAASSELFSKVQAQPVAKAEVVTGGIFSQTASSSSIFSVKAKEPSQQIEKFNSEAVATNPFAKKVAPDEGMFGQSNKQEDFAKKKPFDNIFTRPREENRAYSFSEQPEKVEKGPLLTQQNKPSIFPQSTPLFTDNQIQNQTTVQIKKSSQESQKEAAQESPSVIAAQKPDSSVEVPSPQKKKNEAIGPGGMKIDLPEAGSFFAGQNKNNNIFTGPTNIFGEPSQKSGGPSLTVNSTPSDDKAPVGLFGQSGANSSSFGQNYFNKAASGGGIFGGPTGTSLFGGQTQSSLFGGQSGNSTVGGSSTIGQTIFGGKSSGSLFGGMQPAIFNQGGTEFTTPKEEDEEDKQEENDDGLVEAEEEEIDPTKSTGNYNYVQSNVLFKDTAIKFRHGSKDTLQNVTISLEKFEDNSPAHLFVRLANKCVAFNGTVMSGSTQVRTLNNSSKNLEIIKLVISENSTYSLARVKVQLKDENIGAKLVQELEKLLKV